jgi:four helix bundle protein
MASFKEFEEMEIWQKARHLAREVYRVTGNGAFARDFVLRDQIRRAAISVLSNITEGHERSGNAEFAQFLSIAKGSVGEVKAQLYVAHDQHYVEAQEFKGLFDLTSEIGRMAGGLIAYLRNTNYKGAKFKKRIEVLDE